MSGAGIAGWTGLIGSAFQQRAQVEADRLVANARAFEMNKQKEYAEQAARIVAENAKQQGADTAKQRLAEGQANRLQAFEKIGQQNIYGENQPQQNGMDALRTANLGKHRAVLGSYGDWALRDMIQKIQVQNELNKLYDSAQGQSEVIAPITENQIAHSQDNWKIAGAAIAGGGQVVGAYMDSQPKRSNVPTYINPNPTGPGYVTNTGPGGSYSQFNSGD